MLRLVAPQALREPQRNAVEGNAVQRGAPGLARRNRQGARQRSGGDDLAGRERRVDTVVREQADEMAQRGERTIEDVGGVAAVDHTTVADKIDLERGQRPAPVRSI